MTSSGRTPTSVNQELLNPTGLVAPGQTYSSHVTFFPPMSAGPRAASFPNGPVSVAGWHRFLFSRGIRPIGADRSPKHPGCHHGSLRDARAPWICHSGNTSLLGVVLCHRPTRDSAHMRFKSHHTRGPSRCSAPTQQRPTRHRRATPATTVSPAPVGPPSPGDPRGCLRP